MGRLTPFTTYDVFKVAKAPHIVTHCKEALRIQKIEQGLETL